MTQKRFSLPTLELSQLQLTYLRILYDFFLSETVVQDYNKISEAWDQLKGFSPSDMPAGLINSSTEISLWGIWHLEADSSIYDNVELIVQTIREELRSSLTSKNRFSVKEMASKIKGITEKDIRLAFVQIYGCGLANGRSHSGEQMNEISVASDTLYLTYRNFTTLFNYLRAYYGWDQHGEAVPAVVAIIRDGFSGEPAILLGRANVIRKDDSELTPLFDVTKMASHIGNIIGHLKEMKGQMVGVFGKWGRGKSFLLRELKTALRASTDRQYYFVEYYAWKYQDSPASWAYLYELIAETYLYGEGGAKGFWYEDICKRFRSLWLLFRLNINRDSASLLTKFFLVVTIGWLFIKVLFPFLDWIVIPMAFTSFFFSLTKIFNISAKDLIKRYTLRNIFKSTLGLQAEIQKELIILLKTWIRRNSIGKKKIVLIVEDLDRCSTEKIIHVIEGLRVMLEDEDISKRVVVVAAVDEDILKGAVRQKLSDFEGADSASSRLPELVCEHMDKLFLFAIKLGSLDAEQRSAYLDEIFPSEKSALGENKSEGTKSMSEGAKNVYSNQRGEKETDQQPNKPSDEGNVAQWLELNQFERDFLKAYFKLKHEVTPRRIMVLYLRYLIFKNLLKDYYEGIGKTNPWDSHSTLKPAINLLFDYSNNFKPENVEDDLAVLNSGEDTEKRLSNYYKTQLDKLKVDFEDKIVVLKIMSIVVAY